MSSVTDTIEAATLYQSLGLPAGPVLADVSIHGGPRLIPTAVRLPVDGVAEWAAAQNVECQIVVYCESGGDRSRAAVAGLKSRGWDARYLCGGMAAWRQANYATLRVRSEFRVPGASRWVTRERPKIDRLACPWLIRRFIDPLAQFFYTPAHRVRVEAEALDAEPYDIADVMFSHRGSRCSFDAFLDEFDLHDPVLDELASIVRAADTGEPNRSPQAHGLLAISLGLSANVADDYVLLEQAMPLYDALYAWCKTARTESHGWPTGDTPER